MDELLEQAYERFVVKKEGSTKQRKRIKKSLGAEAQLFEVWSFLFSLLWVHLRPSLRLTSLCPCVHVCPILAFAITFHVSSLLFICLRFFYPLGLCLDGEGRGGNVLSKPSPCLGVI